MLVRRFASASAAAIVWIGCTSQGVPASPRIDKSASEPSLPAPAPAPVADAGSSPRDSGAFAEPDAAEPEAPCLPNGTVLGVTADHVSAYVIDGVEDPALTLCRGMTYTFRVDAPFHPFWVKTEPTLGTGEAFSEGVVNNGTESGDVVFTVPATAPSLLSYICEYHDGMQGELRIRD